MLYSVAIIILSFVVHLYTIFICINLQEFTCRPFQCSTVCEALCNHLCKGAVSIKSHIYLLTEHSDCSKIKSDAIFVPVVCLVSQSITKAKKVKPLQCKHTQLHDTE